MGILTDIEVARIDVPGAGEGVAALPVAGLVQRERILHAVRLEGAQHFSPVVDGGGHFQTRGLQIVAADHQAPHAGVGSLRTGNHAAQAHVAAGVVHRAQIRHVHHSAPVVGGGVGVHDVGIIRQEAVRVGHGHAAGIIAVHSALHDDVRQIARIADHQGEGSRHIVSGGADELQVDVHQLLHFLHDREIIIGAGEGGVIGVHRQPDFQRHATQIRNAIFVAVEQRRALHCLCRRFSCRHGAEAQHHGQGKHDTEKLFHSVFPSIFCICVRFCPPHFLCVIIASHHLIEKYTITMSYCQILTICLVVSTKTAIKSKA